MSKAISISDKDKTGIINSKNIVDLATEYALDVVNEKVLTFWQVKAVAKKWLKDLEDVKTGKRKDIRYNIDELSKVLSFFSHCSHYKTHIGKPFKPEKWQIFLLGTMYCWERWSEEANKWVFRYTDIFVMLGKKGGKSTFCSACAAYDCLFGEPSGAEIYIGAATEDQAKIIWSSTKAFIERNENLNQAFTSINNTIYANDTNRTSFIKPFGRDTQKEGLNPYRVYIDELHNHPDAEVYTTLSDGMIGRQKKGCITITTAGNDIYSFCRKQQIRYENILKGVFEADNVFALIYALPETADITDVSLWYGANPSLGTVKSLEAMKDDFNKAIQLGTLSTFRYKNLNLWTDDRESWLDVAKWNDLARPDTELKSGLYCYGGLDLAQVNDLCAFSLIFPKQDGLPYTFLKSFFFVPRKTSKARQYTDKIPFSDWEKSGHIFISNDEIVRLSDVANFIVGLTSDFDIKAIFYDRAMSREVEAILSDNGLNAFPSYQGYYLSKDIKTFENKVALKELYHDDNPCMQWNISNAAVKINDKEEKMLIKTSGYRKIDGCIAAVEALAAMTVWENNLNNKAVKRDPTFRHTV